MDDGRPLATALSVIAGSIGSLHPLGYEEPSDAQSIDLQGRCMIPGFTDSQVPFATRALPQRQIWLDGCRKYEDAWRPCGGVWTEFPVQH